MSKADSVQRLPFDQYQRYRLVADIVERLRRALGAEAGARLAILDVGGRTGLLRRFLPHDQITLVDPEPDEGRERLVLGDGARLPFADQVFDVVCAFDTLEHVPPSARAAFVAETRRVARRWVILAGPYDAPRVNAAESVLKGFLRDKLKLHHRYLEEHAEHGLPDRAAVERQFAELGGAVTRVAHANLDRWLVLMCLSMYLDEDAALRGLAARFFEFYNASLYASDHAEPVYRHAVIGAFQGAPLPNFADLLAPPVAPLGSLTGLDELAAGLVAFDRERGVWRGERAGFERTVEELRRDLQLEQADRAKLKAEYETHRLEAATGERERDERIGEFEQKVGTLEQDLSEHAAALATHMAEEDRLRAELAAQLVELDAARARAADGEERLAARAAEAHDLSASLGEHMAEEERLRGELAERLAELDAARNTAADLREVRAAQELELGALHADLEEHRRALADRASEIERLVEAHEAEIRGHQANLAARAEELARLNEARAAELAQFEAQLAEHRQVLAHREQLLAEHREVLADREALLAKLRAHFYGRLALKLVQRKPQ